MDNTAPASQNCLSPRDLKKNERCSQVVVIDKSSPFRERYVFCLISPQSESMASGKGHFVSGKSKFLLQEDDGCIVLS